MKYYILDEDQFRYLYKNIVKMNYVLSDTDLSMDSIFFQIGEMVDNLSNLLKAIEKDHSYEDKSNSIEIV